MSSQRLQGKSVLITGAASGIGAAHAKLFAANGAKVLLCDVQQELGEAVAKEIRDDGGVAEFFCLDVANASAWTEAVARAVNTFGSLTTLVNVAGIASSAGLEKETDDGWNKVIAINQKGAWLGMKTAMPELLKSGNGAIVNIASMLAIVGSPGAFAYQASKGALRQMTKSVALEYASRGVRANTVCPGVIETPMLAGGSEKIREFQIQATPMKRLGRPEEIAYCSLFLCSDEASYITAADFIVDGGTTAD
ncbi:MAG TPA: SDR family NAD(P)-dependent oxidoreductase [Spongiibacteraceae bacterium]|nr:SDR family NAD(P)-dependent oxidoreductase [Spongiibacteraceae bacterium]